MSEILAKVLRNGTVESIHRGSLVVIDGRGKEIGRTGNPDLVTFWRSAAKAFQSIPFVTSGAAAAFGFTDKELALACASHSGEPFHTKLVAEMLEKAGFSEESLRCGAHPPFHAETADDLIRRGIKPCQLHNNCSGKHVAMLAFSKHIGADADTYLSPGNPVQGTIFETISLFTGVPLEKIVFGTDGCSAPNFALPLSSMARAYANLIIPPTEFEPGLQAACLRIVQAIMKYPEYVGGSIRLDTKIMQALPGQIVCKVGAEGIWTAGVLPCHKWPDGLAIALKIEDGNDDRARPAVAIELLRRLGVMNAVAEKILGEFSPQKLINRKNIEVGEVVADFDLDLI